MADFTSKSSRPLPADPEAESLKNPCFACQSGVNFGHQKTRQNILHHRLKLSEISAGCPFDRIIKKALFFHEKLCLKSFCYLD